MLTLQFDGLYREAHHDSHPNSTAGYLCYGWVIMRNGKAIARGHGGYVRGKYASSLVAEYLALVEGLEALLDMHAEEETIVITGDAKSVIDQMEGYATVAAESIKPLYKQACRLAASLYHIYWNWTPRRFNQESDALTRRALRQLKMNPELYETALQTLMKTRHNGHGSTRLLPVLDVRLFRAATN